jgi:hypothetical protein
LIVIARQPQRIERVQRIVSHIGIKIVGALRPDRVSLQEPPEVRRIDARPEILQPIGLRIDARKPVEAVIGEVRGVERGVALRDRQARGQPIGRIGALHQRLRLDRRVRYRRGPAQRVIAEGGDAAHGIGDVRESVIEVIGIARDVAVGVRRGQRLAGEGVDRAGRA